MTIASFARYFAPHDDPTFTRVIASRDAKTIVAATTSGGIWVFDAVSGAKAALELRKPEANGSENMNGKAEGSNVAEGGLTIVPKLKLLGHRSQIAVLELCKLESEVVDGDEPLSENGILSCSEDGEVALWDRFDGRCHLSRPHCFPARPTSAQLTPSGKHILIGGHSNEVVVLETATLKTVKVLGIYDDWVSTFCVLPTELIQNALVVTATFSNTIRISLFDENMSAFTADLVDPYQLEFPGWTQAHLLERSDLDDRILFVLSKKACSIFAIERNRTIAFLCNIPVPEGRSWAGLRHLDDGLVMLWTFNGTAQVFSFGSEPHCSRTNDSVDLPLTIGRRGSPPDEKSYHSKHVVANLLLPEQDVLPSYPVTNDDDDTAACVLRLAQDDHTNFFTLLCFKSIPASIMELYWFNLSVALTTSGFSPLPAEPYRLSSAARIRFSDIFTPKTGSEGTVTSSALLKRERVALGYDDGSVRIVPLAAMFYQSGPHFSPQESSRGPTWECREAHPHQARTTALFEMNGSHEAEDELLIGYSDGRVVVLSMSTLETTAVFQCHVEIVIAFFRPPRQILPRYSHLVCSVAADNSIVLIDLEESKILLTFSGHDTSILLIAFRPEDSFMCVKTLDGLLHVWSLKSGHLDRLESDEAADDILATCDQKSRVTVDPAAGTLDSPHESTVVAYSVNARRPGEGVSMLLISANIKRLCQTASRGKKFFRSSSSSTSLLFNGRVDHSPNPETAEAFHIKRLASPPPRTPPPPKTPPPGANSRLSLTVPDVQDSPGRPSMGRATPSDFGDGGEAEMTDEAFAHATLSACMSWGMEPSMDKMYLETLELAVPSRDLTLASKGAGGFWSCFSPEMPRGKAEWCLSHHLTAQRILNALVLSRSILSLDSQHGGEGFEEQIATIITHYGVLLPELVGPEFRLASLGFLVRFWQDPLPEIQQAARSIFRATVSKWSASTWKRAIRYWFSKLSGHDVHASSEPARAAIILAVLGSSPEQGPMDTKIKGEVAAALIAMAGEGKIGFRVAALELLGRGFSTWEPHISAVSLIRYLEQLAGFLPALLGSPAATPTSAPVAVQPPSVQQMARQAILSIATSSTAVFVQTLVLDLTHAKTAEERKGCLRLISVFVHKKPGILQPHLLRIVEGVIKCLEPNNSQLRETLLQYVTTTLADLVKTFPSIAFHGSTQRLLCGDWDGPCVVFDLKTGQKWQILEGHGTCSAAAFAPSGKVAATFSAEDGAVLIFYLSSSFFGLLSGSSSAAGGGLKPIRASKFLQVGENIDGSVKLPPRSPKVGEGWQAVKLEFTGENVLKLGGIAGGTKELRF